MGASQVAAFLGVSLLVIVTPGQDTALTIRNTLAGGRRSGIFTAVGVVSGQVTWAVAASAGLAAVLLASQPAFTALRLVGAAYLVFLGAQVLLGAFRSRPEAPVTVSRSRALAGAYRQGLLSNLTNPKMAVFFPSLLPQFVPSGGASFWALLSLGLVFSALTLGWLAGYALVVAKAGDLLRRPRIRKSLEGVTGAVLVGLGLRLATERA